MQLDPGCTVDGRVNGLERTQASFISGGWWGHRQRKLQDQSSKGATLSTAKGAVAGTKASTGRTKDAH